MTDKIEEKKAEKEKVDGVDTIAGTVDVKIEPAKSTVQGTKPKSHEDKAEKEIAELKKNPEKAEVVVSSVAQLRDAAQAQGATVSTEQVAAARKAEEDTAKAGAELHRPPAAERSKKK